MKAIIPSIVLVIMTVLFFIQQISHQRTREMWDKVIEIVLSDTSWHNEGLVEKLQSQYKLIKK